jgi:methyl-accepting chemotaxis protein
MKVTSTISVRQKLILMAAFCLVGVGALSYMSLSFMRDVQRESRHVSEERFMPLSSLQELSSRLKELRFRLAGVLLDEMPVPGSRNHLKETMDQAPAQWNHFKAAAGTLDEPTSKLVSDIDAAMPALSTFASALDSAYAAGDKKVLTGLLEDEWPIIQQKIVKPLDQLLPALSGSVAKDMGAIQSEAIRFRTLMLTAALLIVTVCVTISFVITRTISRSLQLVADLLRKIGAGQLDNSVDTARNDEFGRLLQGVSATQEALRARADQERRLAEEQQARAEADRQRAEADRLRADADRKAAEEQQARAEAERARAEADQRALEEMQRVVAAVVDGDLGQRLVTSGKSAFATQLAQSINGLIENVDGVVGGVGRIVERANAGDLTQRLETAGRSGLERQIGTSINQLLGQMTDVVAKVKEAATEMSRGARGISGANTDLSSRTESQAASIEEAAASMHEMTTAVANNAASARQANVLANEASQRAERGGAAVADAVAAMSGINESSRKIADIIGVIDEIAFQTNLLALNAAVEAARAGEHGRGFAVVAAEVRALASRSASAAKQIKSLILDSVRRVEDGSKQVSASGEALQQLMTAVNRFGQIISEISAASDEQSSGIAQLGASVGRIDEATQQNAAFVEELAASTAKLAEHAGGLDDMLSQYQVEAQSQGRLRSAA